MDQKEQSEGTEVTFAWMADSHLMHTQYADSTRSEDIYQALDRAIEAAAPKCDVIVIAGDILDIAKQTPTTIGQLMLIDQKLKSLGKVALCVTGNHDLCQPTWLSVLFPRRTDPTVPGIFPMDGKSIDFKGLKIYGIPPYEADEFRAHMQDELEEWQKHDVLIYHGFVSGITPMYTGNKNVLKLSELPHGGKIKFMPLGDIHIQQFVTHEGVLTGYPGSLEMIRINEPSDKSVPLVRVTATAAEMVGTIPTKTRAYVGGKIRSEEDLVRIVDELRLKAPECPLVVLEYDRDIPGVVERIYSVVDPHRSVVRVSPLPRSVIAEAVDRMDGGAESVRAEDVGDRLSLDHFMRDKLDGDSDLQEIGAKLLLNPDMASEVIAKFIEDQKSATRAIKDDF